MQVSSADGRGCSLRRYNLEVIRESGLEGFVLFQLDTYGPDGDIDSARG